MDRFSEMCEIIPGLLIGCTDDAGQMVFRGADVLVPLASLSGSIWRTTFRGEVLYCPIEDMGVLPDDVLNELVDRICEKLENGKKVGIFCSGGHGRTGYIAACVLARHGIRDPIGFLRRNYSEKAIETEQQYNAVFAYARGLRMQQIRKEGLGENFFEYRSYRGNEPYVYLSFSEWDHDVASETVRILNEQGFRVAYDRDVLEGRLWSRSRSDKIEDCSVFLTIHTPCERISHIRLAGWEFAELMEKPIIVLEMDRNEWKYYEDGDGTDIASDPSETDFADRCRKALEQNGIVPHSKDPDSTDSGRNAAGGSFSRRKKEKERRWDLGLVYYEHYGDGQRGFRNERERNCNLRTREAYDSHHNSLDRPSDEALYRAIGWKCIRFDLFPRSRGYDYIASDEDREFRRRICTLGGKPVPEIRAEYEKAQKRIDDYWRDYPYMDEFEYVNSRFDD